MSSPFSWLRVPVLAGALVLVGVAGIACGDDDDDDSPAETASPTEAAASDMPVPYPFDDPTTLDNGIEYVDTDEGDGEEAEEGDVITVHYTGTFLDGEVFDSSEGRDPATFQLQNPGLIEGWVEGIPGMKVGGTRLLYLPSELAYGERGNGPIPPNTPLLFKVQLLGVQ